MAEKSLKQRLAGYANEAAIKEISRERMPNTGETYSVISKRGLASLKANQQIVEGILMDASAAGDAA